MIGRLLEDLIFLVRFLWLFKKAPDKVEKVGFYTTHSPLTVKERVKWAWINSVGR